MSPSFRPTPGAKGYQHSCTPVFSSIPLLATLELIDQATFPAMLQKQRLLTGALEALLRASKFYSPTSASPAPVPFPPEAPWRGTQLSLYITPHLGTDGGGKGVMPRVFARMLKRGLVGDEREPSVIRLSPVVLYNTFAEVGRAVRILEESLEEELEWQRLYGEEAEAEAVYVEQAMLGKG